MLELIIRSSDWSQ